MRIEARAPVRIDLAGGTVDLWPLYLLVFPQVHPPYPTTTLNLAINLFARASLDVEKSGGRNPKIRLVSKDQGAERTLSFHDLESKSIPKTLALHARYLKYFLGDKPPKTSLTLTTEAESPAGAGLGGSSALSVAICGALSTWKYGKEHLDSRDNRVHLIEVVRDIESQILYGPAGLQDFYGAAFGGLQNIHWKIGTSTSEPLPWDIGSELERRVILFYSGQSRNSGINNWLVYKSLVDRNTALQKKFQTIVQATSEIHTALKERAWKDVGRGILKEWTARKALAKGISTPGIDRAFRAAFRHGAVAGKICGAGGGGCFFVYTEDGRQAVKNKIIESVQSDSVRHLPFEAVPHGLTVTVHA